MYKKIIIRSIEAIVIIVIMAISASSNIISQTSAQNFSIFKNQSRISDEYFIEQQTEDCRDLVFIARDAKFSVLHLPMLYHAIKEIPIEYKDIHIFLQQLKNNIISKKYIDVDGIKQILNELNISTSEIYIGSIYTSGYSAGHGICFRRPFGGFSDILPIIIPSLIRWWATSESNQYIGVEIFISGNKITYDHRGWVFGYIGRYESDIVIRPGGWTDCYLYFDGLAPIIWVRQTI